MQFLGSSLDAHCISLWLKHVSRLSRSRYLILPIFLLTLRRTITHLFAPRACLESWLPLAPTHRAFTRFRGATNSLKVRHGEQWRDGDPSHIWRERLPQINLLHPFDVLPYSTTTEGVFLHFFGKRNASQREVFAVRAMRPRGSAPLDQGR